MDRLWLVSYGAAWLLVTAQVFTVVLFLWVLGRIHLKRAPEAHALVTDEGPEVHSAMPGFEGQDINGRWIRDVDYRGRHWVLLLLSHDCDPCEQLLIGLTRTLRGLPAPPDLLIVMESTREVTEAYRRRYQMTASVIIDEGAFIRTELGIDRIPYGLLVDAEGIVRMKGVVSNQGQLEGLIQRRGRYIGRLEWETKDESDRPARLFPIGDHLR